MAMGERGRAVGVESGSIALHRAPMASPGAVRKPWRGSGMPTGGRVAPAAALADRARHRGPRSRLAAVTLLLALGSGARTLEGSATQAPAAAELQYDIVINGGSFSAVAAALAAARTDSNARILLIEPTDWLGGQATSGGVAAIDNAWHEPGASLMRNNPALYYPADYREFLARLQAAPPEAPGEGFAPNGSAWVTREAFDPRTAAWVLEGQVGDHANITLAKLTVVKAVETADVADDQGAGKRIVAVTLITRTPTGAYQPFQRFLSEEVLDWYDPGESANFAKTLSRVTARDPARGLVVIDASELADVVVLSGARYTVGRELTTEVIGDDGTLPAMDEDGTQAFVFPFCMTDASAPDPELELKAPFAEFDAYYQAQKVGYFSLGSHSWNRVLTYRRLRNTGPLFSFDTVNPGDVSMQNWYPGNDYPYGTFYKDRAGAAAEAPEWRGGIIPSVLAEAEKHAVAWYFFMKENRTTFPDTRMLRGTDPLNMMGTGSGLSKYPYVRGTRRIVGLHNFRITERYFADTKAVGYAGGSSFRYYDSVGIGNYAADIHPSKASRGISPSVAYPAPFYIPCRALGSVNVRNLVAAGKLIALTYITNSAYRLHPIEWAVGSAAGTAAARMGRDGLTNYQLLEIPRLRALQAAVNANSPISWAVYDAEPVPQQNGEIVANDLKPVRGGVPFDVEVYHHTAVRARVHLDGVLLGETSQRANGRLVLNVASAPAGSYRFSAVCLDGAGNVLDVLSAFDETGVWIVDNEDPRCARAGAWIRGTAQPNKHGPSYDYSWGGSGQDTATWELPIPRSGRYRVFTWYPEASNRASDAPFTIVHGGGQTTTRVNQQTRGGQWVSLGEYGFETGSGGRVILSDGILDLSKLVVADAVKVEPVPFRVSGFELD